MKSIIDRTILYNNQQIDVNTIPFMVLMSKLLKQIKLFFIHFKTDMISKIKHLTNNLVKMFLYFELVTQVERIGKHLFVEKDYIQSADIK